jgi:hypothetical protein
VSFTARIAQSRPVRLWRYLTQPSGASYRERYEAMSEEQKAQERWRSMKLNGVFLAFADMKPRRGKRTPSREPGSRDKRSA